MAEQTQSRLFTLPAELRVQIYELVVHIPQQAQIRWRSPLSEWPPTVLSLLQTCRKMHTEAAEIFYAINKISYSLLDDEVYTINTKLNDRLPNDRPTSFLAAIGSRRRNAITSLTISPESGSLAIRMIEQLHLMPNLRSLHFQFPYYNPHSQGLYSWTGLAKELKSALGNMEHLQEVKLTIRECPGTFGYVQALRRFQHVVATTQETVVRQC